MDYKARYAIAPIMTASVIYVAATSITLPQWAFAISGVATIAVGIVGVVKFSFFWQDNRNKLLAEKREALAITPESVLTHERTQLAKELRHLINNDKALDIVGRGQEFELRIELNGEQYISDTGVPLWFAYEFMNTSDRQYLASRSSFGNMDSQKYKWADALTKYLVGRGAAKENRTGRQWTGGNRSAEWVNETMYDRVWRAWSDDEPPSPTTDIPTSDEYLT